MKDSHEKTSSFATIRLLRFPSRRGKLLLPERPLRAAITGLDLYETRRWHQRMLVLAGRGFLRLKLGGALRIDIWPSEAESAWWQGWITEVGSRMVERIDCAAMILLEGRQAVLLFDRDGRSLAFAKAWSGPAPQTQESPEVSILDALSEDPPRSFRVPRMLAHGVFKDRYYQLVSPLPEGRKCHPPPEPATIATVVDEFQQRLAPLLDRDASTSHYVMGHGDFSHRNLRLASDGRLWLFDWEYAGPSPRLADELRYWATWFGAHPWPRVDRDSAKMLNILRDRGTDSEILEAVCWPEHNRPIEQALRDAVRAKLSAE